eukprot:11559988-Alexandrium_andersonii.AAC.1
MHEPASGSPGTSQRRQRRTASPGSLGRAAPILFHDRLPAPLPRNTALADVRVHRQATRGASKGWVLP